MKQSEQELWTFYYHEGPAHRQGICRARDERMAFAVAVRWCDIKGFRPPAVVRKMVVADESILEVKVGPEEMPVAVAAVEEI